MKDKLFKQIIEHTLKTPDGRYSRMSIIIASSWAAALFMAMWDFFDRGFSFEVWATLCGIAVGTKIASAQAKAIEIKAKNDKVS